MLAVSLSLTTPLLATDSLIVPLDKTFTIDNIEDTFTMTTTNTISKLSSTYFIDNTNTVRAIGSSIYGAGGAVVNSTEWVPIVKDSVGTLLDKIVKVKLANTYDVYFIDSDGNLYYTGNLGFNPYTGKTGVKTLATRVDGLPKIADVATPKICKNSAESSALLLTADGDLYYSSYGNSAKRINGDIKFKRVIDWNTSLGYGRAISKDGKLYRHTGTSVVPFLDSQGNHVSNISDAFCYSPTGDMYLLTESGEIYRTLNNIIERVNFIDSSGLTVYPFVEKILENNQYNNTKHNTHLKTSLGTFSLDGLTATYVDLEFNPVAYEDFIANREIGMFIDDRGNIHAKGENTNGWLGDVPSDSTTYNSYREPWMNDNPIVSDVVLANFNIDMNNVLDRGNLEVKMSCITEKEPTAFNLYYALSEDILDRSKWVSIESGVPVSELSPVEYDSGYTDNAGNKLIGKTYTYTWKTGSEYMVGIRIIAESVY